MAIAFALVMKFLAIAFVLAAFFMRFGPSKEEEKSSKFFYASFGIEFSPFLLNLFVWPLKKTTFYLFFHHSKSTFLFFLFHLAIGISLIVAFEIPEQIDPPDQKGLAGLYCICSTYCLFRSSRDLLDPTFFEMFGWFEVVFKKIIELLAVSINLHSCTDLLMVHNAQCYLFKVHSWLLLTFVVAFYIQLSNFAENTEKEVWVEACKTKLNNCTKVIIALDTSTELKVPNVLNDCVEFFKECSKTEPEKKPFNDWKVMFKTLSMSAGELTFDDMPFEDNAIYILTFALFIILVIFVIMNLMTSLAVNNIQEIRNESRDGTWYKLLLTLKWYNAVLPDRVKEKFGRYSNDVNVISFKLTKPKTWCNFLTSMPESVSEKAQGNAQPLIDKFSIEHNEDMDIVIIFGTKKKFYEVTLRKGVAYERPLKFWRAKFAIVDFPDGHDTKRNMYRAQCFNISGSTKLEIRLKKFDGIAGHGQFVVFDQNFKSFELVGTIKQYVNAEPTKQVEDTIRKYKGE